VTRRCLATVLSVLLAACATNDRAITSTTDPSSSGAATRAPARTIDPAPASPARSETRASSHRSRPRIAVIVLENKEYETVIGSERAPYFNDLARDWGLATSFYAITHPSLPNYLAMTSGRHFKISNCTDCHFDVPNIVDQFERAKISWKAYIEGFPGACFTGAVSGRYAKKHNPFIYYDSVASNPKRCAKIVPTTELDRDIASSLPRFVWITPDMCNSSHDCSFEQADDYLASVVPKLLAALGKDGVLIITFDEGSTTAGCCKLAAGGHIATILAGPGARPGKFTKPVDLYSVLRLIEDRWKLPHLGQAACPCTPSMDPMLR
jgi:phosphatidylinositol-3-phosphatase